jgi:hypothetical protein
VTETLEAYIGGLKSRFSRYFLAKSHPIAELRWVWDAPLLRRALVSREREMTLSAPKKSFGINATEPVKKEKKIQQV